MKRVICLYRVSTVGQVDHDDIPMQKIACREYAATHQDWEIIDEISEKGVSGYKVSTNARDAIIEIKKRAMAKEFDVLLVFMFDRLGRREDETPFVVQWFVQQGIEVWSTREGEQRFDTHVDTKKRWNRPSGIWKTPRPRWIRKKNRARKRAARSESWFPGRKPSMTRSRKPGG